MLEVTIDRSRWRNSHHGIGGTCLLNQQGYMCCLGFTCIQLASSKIQEIHGRLWPSIEELSKIIPNIQDNVNQTFVGTAMSINDNPEISLQMKETRLINLFHKYNINLKFMGQYNE